MNEKQMKACLAGIGVSPLAIDALARHNLLNGDALTRITAEELVLRGLKARCAVEIKQTFPGSETDDTDVWAGVPTCAPASAPASGEQRLGMFLGARAPYAGPVTTSDVEDWLDENYKLDEFRLVVAWMESNFFIAGRGARVEWDNLQGDGSKVSKMRALLQHLEPRNQMAAFLVLFGREAKMKGDWAAELTTVRVGDLEAMYAGLSEEFDSVRQQPPLLQARELVRRMKERRELELMKDWRDRHNMKPENENNRVWLNVV